MKIDIVETKKKEFDNVDTEALEENMELLLKNARWKKKDFLGNIFNLYLDRYGLLEALEEDKSDSGKVLLEKVQKLFGYSKDDDDPRDKIAVKNYENLSEYFENQPLEFYANLNSLVGMEEMVDLLCEAYEKIGMEKDKIK